jgi:hypothetical protein
MEKFPAHTFTSRGTYSPYQPPLKYQATLRYSLCNIDKIGLQILQVHTPSIYRRFLFKMMMSSTRKTRKCEMTHPKKRRRMYTLPCRRTNRGGVRKVASLSRERYGRWKEKELGFEKEELFGEEEGKEELEGGESYYGGSSGDLTSSTSSNGKEEVEEDNGDGRVFLSSFCEEEEEEEEEEEQEEEEEWNPPPPPCSSSHGRSSRKRKRDEGEEEKVEDEFLFEESRSDKVVIERTWF